MNYTLKSQVLMQRKVASNLLAMGHRCDECRAKHRRQAVEECNGFLAAPDNVVRGKARVALDQSANEASLFHISPIGNWIKAHSIWLVEHASGTQRISYDSAVARRIALQATLLVGFKATVVKDYESQAVGVGPGLAPLIV